MEKKKGKKKELSKVTTVRISTATRDKLHELGKMGDSYDTLIFRLCEFYEAHKEKIEQNKKSLGLAALAAASAGALTFSAFCADGVTATLIGMC
jgi:hypothetical protein